MHFHIIAAMQCLLLVSADGGVDLRVEEERLHSPGEGLGAEMLANVNAGTLWALAAVGVLGSASSICRSLPLPTAVRLSKLQGPVAEALTGC